MDPQLQPNNNSPQQPTTPIPTPTPTPSGSPQDKNKMLLIVAAVAVVVILGVLAFIMLGSNKDNTKNESNSSSNTNGNTPTPDPSKFQTYNVTDKLTGAAYTVSFYKNAKVEEKNGRTYLNSGEAGSIHSVYLGIASGDKIDCGNAPTTTMKLGGKSTTVCYQADNTQYAGYANSKKGPVKINLAGQIAISAEDAKTIMESVTFN